MEEYTLDELMKEVYRRSLYNAEESQKALLDYEEKLEYWTNQYDILKDKIDKSIEYLKYKRQDLEQGNKYDLLLNEYLQFTINLLNILEGDDNIV